MEKKGNNRKVLIAAIVAIVVIAAAATVYILFAPKAAKGNKAITVKVLDDKGKTKEYKHRTDAQYLLDAVKEIKDITVEGTEGEFGLYMEKVNGLGADYDADGAYWALYVNEEYATLSIDKQPIKDGDTYTIKYEVWKE